MADSSICRCSARSRSLHIRDPDEALFTLHDVTRQMDTRLAMGKRYFPAALTKQMLARSRPQVHERWAADDMISVADAATVVGAVPQEMRRWIAKGYCIGVKGPHASVRLHCWQFAPEVWPWVRELSRALGTTSGWAILGFLETPAGSLDGRTPREALESGNPARVLQVACYQD